MSGGGVDLRERLRLDLLKSYHDTFEGMADLGDCRAGK